MLIRLSCCLLFMQYEIDLCASLGRWVGYMLLLMYGFNFSGSHIITFAGLADLHKIKLFQARTPDWIGHQPRPNAAIK